MSQSTPNRAFDPVRVGVAEMFQPLLVMTSEKPCKSSLTYEVVGTHRMETISEMTVTVLDRALMAGLEEPS